jgi:hypothetical protein
MSCAHMHAYCGVALFRALGAGIKHFLFAGAVYPRGKVAREVQGTSLVGDLSGLCTP